MRVRVRQEPRATRHASHEQTSSTHTHTGGRAAAAPEATGQGACNGDGALAGICCAAAQLYAYEHMRGMRGWKDGGMWRHTRTRTRCLAPLWILLTPHAPLSLAVPSLP
eukprot:scaffold11894_cov148-Isochrysis_galbana.AAC.2